MGVGDGVIVGVGVGAGVGVRVGVGVGVGVGVCVGVGVAVGVVVAVGVAVGTGVRVAVAVGVGVKKASVRLGAVTGKTTNSTAKGMKPSSHLKRFMIQLPVTAAHAPTPSPLPEKPGVGDR